jgi:hypothetical protein
VNKNYNNIGEITTNSDYESLIYKTYSEIVSHVSNGRPCDVGFNGSQKPYEFFNAWKVIQKQLKEVEHPTMLEIGAYKGLWAIAFFEWCRLNNKVAEYYTVTWLNQDPNNNDILKVQKYYTDLGFIFKIFNNNSQLSTTKDEVIAEIPTFNFVFIDADHSYEGSKKDIELYSSLATNILGFHDIRPKIGYDKMDVYRAIIDSNITFDKEFICDDTHMGIGLKYN